jgi:phosphate transport system substrate-binding protein
MHRGTRLIALAAATLLLALTAVGCGGDDNGGGGGDGLSGNITIDGSSTVAPLSSAVAEQFSGENSDVNITVGSSGTGGGFERFCAGETDISDASRPIEEEEVAACKEGGVDYQEFRVASDGITLVTGAQADVGADNLTMEQLKAIWGPDSKIKNWSDVPGGDFQDTPLTLAGPDSQSGTYDFFNEEVLGEDDAGEVIEPRQDYTASADDNVIVRAVQSAEAALGYFGFTYYEENADTLKLFKLDGVEPNAETITSGDYPLSRPLFIYVKDSSLEREEVKAFVCYYLENATSVAEEQQFVTAPMSAIDESIQKAGC